MHEMMFKTADFSHIPLKKEGVGYKIPLLWDGNSVKNRLQYT